MISIENLPKKAYFNIDSNEYYEGYHIESRSWNGWAMPSFEKYVADLIAYNCSTTDYKVIYDRNNDCYNIIQTENSKVIEEIKVEKHIINTTDGEKEVYDFGSIGWTWEDYTIDELKEIKDAIIIANKTIEKEDSINMEH